MLTWDSVTPQTLGRQRSWNPSQTTRRCKQPQPNRSWVFYVQFLSLPTPLSVQFLTETVQSITQKHSDNRQQTEAKFRQQTQTKRRVFKSADRSNSQSDTHDKHWRPRQSSEMTEINRKARSKQDQDQTGFCSQIFTDRHFADRLTDRLFRLIVRQSARDIYVQN